MPINRSRPSAAVSSPSPTSSSILSGVGRSGHAGPQTVVERHRLGCVAVVQCLAKVHTAADICQDFAGGQVEIVRRNGADRIAARQVVQHAHHGEMALAGIGAQQDLVQQVEERAMAPRPVSRAPDPRFLSAASVRPCRTKCRLRANRGPACSWPARPAACSSLGADRPAGLGQNGIYADGPQQRALARHV